MLNNYLIQLANLYKVVLCLLGLDNKSEFLNAMKNIETYLTKYTPFSIKDINCFIDDNVKQFQKR